MSNSDPSAIVLHGIPCIGGLYISFDSNGALPGFVRKPKEFKVFRQVQLRCFACSQSGVE